MSEPTLSLLVEIGCEEIPARFLADAQGGFGDQLRLHLLENRLLIAQDGSPLRDPANVHLASLHTYSTPRRLVAHMPAILERQFNVPIRHEGPPISVAVSPDGKYTRAAEGFAAKFKAKVEDLKRETTARGEYLALYVTEPGQSALDKLEMILPAVIWNLKFPKSMTWFRGDAPTFRFVRPIRWIVAVLGEGDAARVIPFEVAGVSAGNITFCHRLVRKPQVAVTGFKDYMRKLRRGHVEIDPARRRKRIRQGIRKLLAASAAGPDSAALADRSTTPNASLRSPLPSPGSPDPGPDSPLPTPDSHVPVFSSAAAAGLVPDAALEDWIVASTEWPTPILGSFEPRFLELPREILITVMRDHQKYFALENSQPGEPAAESQSVGGAALAPLFITVLNVPGDPEGIIRRGHERVLTARLEDARFFWHADQKIPLRERLPMLERVTYQAKLGSQSSYAAKMSRMKAIAAHICASLEESGRISTEQRAHVLRAVDLSKCDLTTQMVQEFTELQGVVGGLYGKAQGEPDDVWHAIYDHYKPVNLEDDCPRSVVGAVVSLADKLEAVVAGFAVGLEPTGSSDPFGLRRAGNGIIKLVSDLMPRVYLPGLVQSVMSLDLGLRYPPALLNDITRFVRERVEYYLQAVGGLRYDTIRALSSEKTLKGWFSPDEALRRGQALEAIRDTADFRALASGAKRTRNILTKSAELEDLAGVPQADSRLLRQSEERDLYNAYQSARTDIDELDDKSDYGAAFRRLARLRPAIDSFFDKVLVMDEDRQVRANRLRLLTDLDQLAFRRFADLSEIET
jgi:glycyl-tRNA synthetase beta chain